MEEKQECKGMSTASLVLGIIGIVLSVAIIGGILGIIGTILGIIAIIKSKPKNKMAIAGVILSLLSIAIVGYIIYSATRDYSAPIINQIGNEVYIGEEIELEKLVEITDLNWLGARNDENVKASYEPIDTTKESTQKLKIVAVDNSNNKTEKIIEINVKNPIITLYDYVQGNMAKKYYYTYTMFNNGNNFTVKYENKDGDYGLIDFTKKNIKSYSSTGSFKFVDIIDFDNNLKVTKIHRTSAYLSYATNEYLDLNDDSTKTTIDIVKSHFNKLLGESNKVNICGKTVNQLKNETIDLRELK